MTNAPQAAHEGSFINPVSSIKEVTIDEAASLIESGSERECLDFGSTKLVVLESTESGRYAVLTTASGRAARLLLQ